jgi:hypothetical protein
MSKQQALHSKAIKHLVAIEAVIDDLKTAGPCRDDGWNALLNTKQRLRGLADRCGTRCEQDI